MGNFMNLARELDRVKARTFLDSNAAFLGSILVKLNFVWDEKTKTAATDGKTIWWNPEFFKSIPLEARTTVLLHEIWHVGRLHPLRRNNRNHKLWNIACDYRINNDLYYEGYSFKGLENCILDPSLDQPRKLAEEEIYDLLASGAIPIPQQGCWGQGDDGDMLPDFVDGKHLTDIVTEALQRAKLSNNKSAGNELSDIQKYVTEFLDPQVPWYVYLNQYLNEISQEDYSWSKRNKRYQNIYLPGKGSDYGSLDHLMYIIDDSGSITDEQINMFNSEIKHIKDIYNPKLLTVVQFDTQITSVKEYLEEDPFEGISFRGRGGTDLSPVKGLIEKKLPTAAVIFSDLYCPPMEVLAYPVPIIWVIIDNPEATVPFGKTIHISLREQ